MTINMSRKVGSAFGGKKLLLIIGISLLLGASCEQQALVRPNTEITKMPSRATGTPEQKPPALKKPASNNTPDNSKGKTNYFNFQNSSTVTQNSSSSGNSNVQNNSTIINNNSTVEQNSSSTNNSSSININLNSSNFPAGNIGQPYSSNITFQQSGNQQIFIEFRGLPPGLGLAVAGSPTLVSSVTIQNPGPTPSVTLTGTPTASGEYNVTIKLDNKNGTVITQNFSLTVKP